MTSHPRDPHLTGIVSNPTSIALCTEWLDIRGFSRRSFPFTVAAAMICVDGYFALIPTGQTWARLAGFSHAQRGIRRVTGALGVLAKELGDACG